MQNKYDIITLRIRYVQGDNMFNFLQCYMPETWDAQLNIRTESALFMFPQAAGCSVNSE